MADSVGRRTRGTLRDLFTAFTLVPWPMGNRIVLMLIVAGVTSLLDLLAVASLLPLTELLTSEAGIPGAVQRIVVPLARTEDRQTLILFTAALIGTIFLLKNVVVFLIRFWSIGTVRRAEAEAQRELLTRYVSSDYESHSLRSQGATINMVMGSVPQAFSVVLGGYISLIVDALTVAALMVTLLVMSPLAAATAFFTFGGCALLVSRVIKPLSISRAQRAFELDREVFNYLNPAIQGFRETRLYHREELFVEGFARNRREIGVLNRFQQVVMEVPRYLLEVVLIVGILLVAVILFLVQDQSTAFGLLAVFAAASMRIIPCLNRIVATRAQIRSGAPSVASLAREIRMLDGTAPRILAEDSARSQAATGQALAVRGLSFRYRGTGRYVLKDIDVDVEAGSTVALVGPSGSGKSTFADILVGLLEPTEGGVLRGGGQPSGSAESGGPRVAMVSQQVYMWTASFKQLVTFELDAAAVDQDLLARVVQQACLTDVVERLPEGMETVIGDGGVRLSGGEAQRVALARALYSRPTLLILDEATSALDNETEHLITRALEGLHGQLTIVLIAHRLSTVRHADDILYFREGTLDGRGTFDDLKASNSRFARMVELGSLNH